ncbi:ThiF family adenylyltransferase [Humisphaera borealis]|uniref:ThiF family adenylyltransferase n=1 Tax=Humisphaera borealis TaxID=2807512 RepID=A0A7M2X2Y3_9BACT|nr:ThiF family adenylyltransferase [Humisphaera borealis]QOV92118.1 ThiF family adenylyltransferase [Humisphaera borealis]
MIRHTLTLQERHLHELRKAVLPASGHEGVAYLLCGTSAIESDPWERDGELRLLSREVIPLAAEDVITSSPDHVRARTATFTRVLKRARDTGMIPVYVHGHPGGYDRFSSQDDADEPALIELAQNRNGPEQMLGSLVLAGPRRMFGRVWLNKKTHKPLSMIRSIGDRLLIDFEGRENAGDVEALARQALAFGPALNADVAALRFGIIGCGATGSAVGLLLARLGAQRIFAVDDDTAELTNLNRLHGATMRDVGDKDGRRGLAKTDILKRSMEEIGLGARVETFKGWVGDPACRNALKACDVIFACTDDHDGRMLLNRLSYFYLIPVIDMGIGIDFVDGSPPRITMADGRVSVVGPGHRCLLCRGVVDPKTAQEDDLLRRDPDEYYRLRERGELYVRGGGRPNPAVVTFTTHVACMAVDELLHRLSGYRSAGSVPHRVYKHRLLGEKRPGPREGTCRVCVEQHYWGRGDMSPFLDRTG